MDKKGNFGNKKPIKSKISKAIEDTSHNIYDINFGSDIALSDIEPKRINNTIIPRLREADLTINTLVKTETEKIYTVNLLMREISTIEDVIEMAIKKYNEEKIQIEDKKGKPVGILYFSEDSSKYHLKPSKKNGRPKVDYPPFLSSITISDTQTNKFALIYKSDAITIRPINNKERNNLSCRDINCGIF